MNINFGIIMDDISDHFPIFYIELNVRKPLKNNLYVKFKTNPTLYNANKYK